MQVTAYDKCAFDGLYSGLIQKRVREASVVQVPSNQDSAEVADLIVSVTPGSALLDSTTAFIGCLRNHHTFIDFASATPKIKFGAADRLAASGALVGDGSIGGTPKDGSAMPILVSGAAGERVRDLLNPCGMHINLVGGPLGTASGIKILCSVISKGIEALTDEMLLAAHHYGIDEAVLAPAARPWRGRRSKP